jgi:arylsulfatase A-like enzyme
VQELDNLIYFPDVMPTLANLARATDKLPQRINGMNILPLFYGHQVETNNRLLYWEFTGKQRAARRGDWKVVSVKKDAPLELYHISKDMTESTNLAQDHPEIVKEFEQEMNKMRTPSPNWPLPNE